MPLGTNTGKNLKGWNNEQSAGNKKKQVMLWIGSSETTRERSLNTVLQ